MKKLLSAIVLSSALSACAADINLATSPVAMRNDETGDVKICQANVGGFGLLGAQAEKSACMRGYAAAGYKEVEFHEEGTQRKTMATKRQVTFHELNQIERPVRTDRDDFEGTTKIWIDKSDLVQQAHLRHHQAVASRQTLMTYSTQFHISVPDSGVPQFVVTARLFLPSAFVIRNAAFGSAISKTRVTQQYHDVSCTKKCVVTEEVAFLVDESFVAAYANGDKGTIRLYTSKGIQDVGLNVDTVRKVYAEYQGKFAS